MERSILVKKLSAKIPGRIHSPFPAETGSTSPESDMTKETKPKASLVDIPEIREVLKNAGDVFVHPPVDATAEHPRPGRTRSNPIVYEAMDLLRSYGYIPVRLSDPSIPINIVALKKSGSLLIFTLRSRLPVPSAAKLRELYTGKVDFLRGLAGKVLDRIMIWVYSPSCGWRYYLVYPGGLRYDLDFPKSLE